MQAIGRPELPAWIPSAFIRAATAGGRGRSNRVWRERACRRLLLRFALTHPDTRHNQHTQTGQQGAKQDHQQATMYNGIGLQTPRGSGTSGHVTKNRGYVPPHRVRNESAMVSGRGGPNDHFKAAVMAKANQDLMEHKVCGPLLLSDARAVHGSMNMPDGFGRPVV